MISYNENKELNSTISRAIKENKPISITTYFLNESGENSLRLITSSILNKFGRMDLMDSCFQSVKSLVNFASKANIKRAIFKEISLDIYNPKDYELGMVEYKKQFNRNNLDRFKATIKSENLHIKTTFLFSPENFNIKVRTNFALLPAERNALKAQFSKLKNINSEEFTDKENSSGLLNNEFGTNHNNSKNGQRDKDVFKIFSSERPNETIIRLEFPLTDKSMFQNEILKIKMDSMLYDYRAQFDTLFHKRLETLDIRTSTLIEDFQRKIKRTREETGDILDRIQKVGSDLYEKQEDLLSQYGEKVYHELEEKLEQTRENTVLSLKEFEQASVTYLREQTESARKNSTQMEALATDLIEKQNESLKQAIQTLEATEQEIHQRYKNIADKSLEQIKQDAREVLASNKSELEEHSTQISQKIENSSKSSLNFHSKQMEAVGRSLEEKIQNLSDNLYERFSERSQQSSQELESKLTGITDESLSRYEQEINVLDKKLEEKIKKLSTESLDNHKFEVEKFNKILHERISNQSTILNGQVKLYLEQMERSSMDFLENLDKKYAKSRQDYEDLHERVEEKLNRANQVQRELTDQMQQERDKVNTLVSEVSERIIEMEKSKVNVDKVHELVKESELAYGKITDKLNIIHSKETDVNQYLKNAAVISEALESSQKEIDLLTNQKQEIESMKQELNTIATTYDRMEEKSGQISEKVAILDVIDERMNTLEKFQSDVNGKLVEVTNLARTLSNLETALGGQEKKSQDIEGKFGRFYKELEFLLEKGNELNQTILDMDEKVSIVNDKTLDIKLMESKFNKIESMMADLSMRHKQIATMERRLEEMKDSMQYILEKADEKVDKLSEFVDDVNSYDEEGVEIRVGRKQNANFSDLMKKLKEKVLNLHEQQDMSAEEIANHLGVEKALVDSIIHNIPYYI